MTARRSPACAARGTEGSPASRFRLGGCVVLISANFTCLRMADQADGQRSLDLRYRAALGPGAESGGDSACAGAAGTAHAMNEIFRRLRKVVVHDVRDAIDVDAASRNIGGDEHAIVSLLKSAERLVTLILAAIAVNGGRLNTVIGKPAS